MLCKGFQREAALMQAAKPRRLTRPRALIARSKTCENNNKKRASSSVQPPPPPTNGVTTPRRRTNGDGNASTKGTETRLSPRGGPAARSALATYVLRHHVRASLPTRAPRAPPPPPHLSPVQPSPYWSTGARRPLVARRCVASALRAPRGGSTQRLYSGASRPGG